jgi:hypothetical protein
VHLGQPASQKKIRATCVAKFVARNAESYVVFELSVPAGKPPQFTILSEAQAKQMFEFDNSPEVVSGLRVSALRLGQDSGLAYAFPIRR